LRDAVGSKSIVYEYDFGDNWRHLIEIESVAIVPEGRRLLSDLTVGDNLRVATFGWARWAPVNAAAIGAHLVGAVGMLVANRDRVRNQQGVGASSVVKTALTVAARRSASICSPTTLHCGTLT